MHRMEAPKPRYSMQQDVPNIKRIVHQHQCDQSPRNSIETKQAGDPPLLLFNDPCKRLNNGCFEQNGS